MGLARLELATESDGRPKLIQCMLDPPLLLLSYNLAATDHNRNHKDKLALWSPEFLRGLGLDTTAKNSGEFSRVLS